MSFKRRKTILVNPQFQLRFTLSICGLLVLGSIFYPLTLYDVLSGIAEKHPESQATIEAIKADLSVILLGMQIGFLGVVYVIGMFFSHKIAGPIYKIQTVIGSIIDGGPITPIHLRQGDHFQDLARDLNGFFEHLKESETQEIIYLSEVKSYLEKISSQLPESEKGNIQDICSKIGKILEKFDSKN